MARNIASLNIIITCFLIFFCTFSSSIRTPYEIHEVKNDNDDNNNNNVNDIDQTNQDSSFPMSVKNPLDENSIFLPSENLPEPDSKPETLIQSDPKETNHESKIDAPTTTTTTTTTKTTESSLEEAKQQETLPLTVFRFSPIDNTHIPRPLNFRHPAHHRCHHAHQHYKPWNNRHLPDHTNDEGITKINDDVQSREFDTMAAHGGVRRIPSDWMRYEDDINEMFLRDRSKAIEDNELLKRIYERYNQHRRQQAEDEAEVKDTRSRILKRIRKVLSGF